MGARASSATDQPRKALRLGREALSIADTTEDVLLRSGARLDLAEVQLRAGRKPEALSLVREGLELLDRKGAALPAEHARSRFAELLAEADDGGAALCRRAPRTAHLARVAVLPGIRAGSPGAGATVCIVAAATTIITTMRRHLARSGLSLAKADAQAGTTRGA